MAQQPIHLLGLATAVPGHGFSQAEAEGAAAGIFIDNPALFERLRPVYAHAGVARRYSSVPLDWFRGDHGWPDRARLFVETALDLCEQAADACLARAGLGRDDVGAVVAVTTTGVATPSLDALVMERLGLPRRAARLPVFGLGCAGGVVGLARAADLARSMPGRRVLLLVVELCSLTFRRADSSKSNLVATALFGDGAAAALLCSMGDGPTITGAGEHTWPDSLDVMGWRVETDGLGVLFSRDIPALVTQEMRTAAEAVLGDLGLGLADIDSFLCHPGGAKVLDALEACFALPSGTLALSRGVLRDYGNMSAATVLFVLERALSGPAAGPVRHLLSTLGPGFTAAFLTLETG